MVPKIEAILFRMVFLFNEMKTNNNIVISIILLVIIIPIMS